VCHPHTPPCGRVRAQRVPQLAHSPQLLQLSRQSLVMLTAKYFGPRAPANPASCPPPSLMGGGMAAVPLAGGRGSADTSTPPPSDRTVFIVSPRGRYIFGGWKSLRDEEVISALQEASFPKKKAPFPPSFSSPLLPHSISLCARGPPPTRRAPGRPSGTSASIWTTAPRNPPPGALPVASWNESALEPFYFSNDPIAL